MEIKIIFTKDTTKELRKWLKVNEFGCGARLGKEMLFEPNDNYVSIPKVYDDSLDDYFMKWLRKNGLHCEFSPLTFSVLHELGHAETMLEYFDEDDEIDYVNNVNEISMRQNTTQEQDCFDYWDLTVEKVANQFAIAFAETYPKETKDLQKLLFKTMRFEMV